MSQKLAIIVTSNPISNRSVTALQIVEGALRDQYIDLIGVFFYQEGVSCANQLLTIASDEFQTLRQWQAISLQYQLPLHLCITAAELRGMTDTQSNCNIAAEFIVSGLGQLVELTVSADRILQL
jgi:tRNA 2-thiouridine synthesizing protein D